MKNCIKFYFFDASAIVKLLVEEPGSDKVKAILNDTNARIYSSWVLLAETLNVLKRQWFQKNLSDSHYDSVIYFFFSLLKENRIKPIDIFIEGNRAQLKTYDFSLINIRKKHSFLDAADALQLIAIKDGILKNLAGESRPLFVTADENLKKAAEEEGIKVLFITST